MRGLLPLAAALLVAPSAAASIGITFGAVSNVGLRVDSAGNAEISWSAGGARRTLLVPPSGRYLPGGRLSNPDVSRSVAGPALPYRKALRRTPDGRYWALQAWQTGFTGPLELRFSRWRGAPTKITLTLVRRGRYDVLSGRATFHGRPVTGTYRTNAGTPIPLAAQLDCFGCSAARGRGWHRFNGVRTRGDGSFGSGLRRDWMGTRYRATIVGPNDGATLAPDAAAIASGR
jgi:hypothetical protein